MTTTITDADIAALRERNAERAAAAIAALGKRYLCRPTNHVTREACASVLVRPGYVRANVVQLHRRGAAA